jgi:hypothetical protein
MFILNSSNVQVYNNTFVNSTACIARNARTPANDRMFGWHSSTGPDFDKREGHVFVNNLLTGDPQYLRPLLFLWQPDSLCQQLPAPLVRQLDYNVYVRGAEKGSSPLILWSPTPAGEQCQVGFESLSDLRKFYPQFSVHGSSFDAYDGPLFKSAELGNYQLLPSAPGATSGMQLPADVKRLLGLSKKGGQYTGAYPQVP